MESKLNTYVSLCSLFSRARESDSSLKNEPVAVGRYTVRVWKQKPDEFRCICSNLNRFDFSAEIQTIFATLCINWIFIFFTINVLGMCVAHLVARLAAVATSWVRIPASCQYCTVQYIKYKNLGRRTDPPNPGDKRSWKNMYAIWTFILFQRGTHLRYSRTLRVGTAWPWTFHTCRTWWRHHHPLVKLPFRHTHYIDVVQLLIEEFQKAVFSSYVCCVQSWKSQQLLLWATSERKTIFYYCRKNNSLCLPYFRLVRLRRFSKTG